MAFQVKYRCEFKDLNGIEWKVEIEQDPWAGSVTTLVASDDPLRFEWSAESDDVFDPIKTSEASLTVWSQTSFALTDLYSEEDLKFRVKIYQATVLYWTGFIITDNYSEPYIDVPYPVTITASCGLEQLKNILYDDSGTYYDGRIFESQIIIDILGKIGYTGFTEYINLYEETMAVTADDSPLDQIKIDVDIFQDMYCYEVLKELLKKYNACIVHKAGGFVLYRPTELVGATVYGRIFTAFDTKSSTTFTPVKYIDRTTNTSTLRQIPGGVMMIQRPAKKVTIFQDFGNKESWINNWQFLSNTYVPSPTFKFTGWTYSGSGIVPISNLLPGEKDGVPILVATGSPNAYNISQSFGAYAVNSANNFKIEFDYLTYNPINTNNITIWIMIKADGGNYWLTIQNDITAVWATSSSYITFTEATIIGSSGWKTFSRLITGLPIDGNYTIYLHPPNGYAGSFAAFKNIKFYSSSDETNILKTVIPKSMRIPFFYFIKINYNKTTRKQVVEQNTTVVQKEISSTNAINGKDIYMESMVGDVKATEVNLDNVIEQFGGSLAVATVIGYTGSTDRVDTVTLNGGTGSGTVQCGGISRTITWNTSTSQTIDDFLASEAAYFTGFTLTKTGATTFTFTASNYNFAAATISASMGSAANTTAFSAGTPVNGLGPTIDWNSYDGTHTSNAESKPLLEIIGDEIAEQYSRPKQLIQMALYDEGAAVSAVDILGNYQDELNQVSAVNRKFVFNRGEFGVKFRNWMIDLMEII